MKHHIKEIALAHRTFEFRIPASYFYFLFMIPSPSFASFALHQTLLSSSPEMHNATTTTTADLSTNNANLNLNMQPSFSP